LDFTDEACFTRDGIFNFNDAHMWDDENHYALGLSNHQHQFSVSVWMRVIGDKIVSLYQLPEHFNGQMYHKFLQDVMPALLEVVPLGLSNTV
jgi:hypothetical protein